MGNSRLEKTFWKLRSWSWRKRVIDWWRGGKQSPTRVNEELNGLKLLMARNHGECVKAILHFLINEESGSK